MNIKQIKNKYFQFLQVTKSSTFSEMDDTFQIGLAQYKASISLIKNYIGIYNASFAQEQFFFTKLIHFSLAEFKNVFQKMTLSNLYHLEQKFHSNLSLSLVATYNHFFLQLLHSTIFLLFIFKLKCKQIQHGKLNTNHCNWFFIVSFINILKTLHCIELWKCQTINCTVSLTWYFLNTELWFWMIKSSKLCYFWEDANIK